MMVRIKLEKGPAVQQRAGKNRQVASAIGTLLVPVTLMAYILGIWRLASDLGMAGEFAISGLFSHWQVWTAIGALLHIASSSLNRYGRGGTLNPPKLLHFRNPSDTESPLGPPKKVRLR